MSHFIRLSYTLTEDTVFHPVLSGLKITPRNRISSGSDYNTSVISIENHCGTHVDAPAHFIDGEKTISEFNADDLVFYKPVYINCPKGPDELITPDDLKAIPEDCDCILINTDFAGFKNTDTEKYLKHNPALSPEASLYLREKHPSVGCVGIDSVSMARYGRPEEAVKVHQTAFKQNKNWGRSIFFVEEMDLSRINADTPVTMVQVIPWQIAGIDSAPCTVLAQTDN
ncbi:MAG: cyclase family protein [Treponema sp.]|nr:cyclase family protein [Treponema sp.]